MASQSVSSRSNSFTSRSQSVAYDAPSQEHNDLPPTDPEKRAIWEAERAQEKAYDTPEVYYDAPTAPMGGKRLYTKRQKAKRVFTNPPKPALYAAALVAPPVVTLAQKGVSKHTLFNALMVYPLYPVATIHSWYLIRRDYDREDGLPNLLKDTQGKVKNVSSQAKGLFKRERGGPKPEPTMQPHMQSRQVDHTQSAPELDVTLPPDYTFTGDRKEPIGPDY